MKRLLLLLILTACAAPPAAEQPPRPTRIDYHQRQRQAVCEQYSGRWTDNQCLLPPCHAFMDGNARRYECGWHELRGTPAVPQLAWPLRLIDREDDRRAVDAIN